MSKRTPKAVVPEKVTPAPPGCDTKERKINSQEVAIEALISGESVTSAAQMAGIRRETLSRWLNGNPVFIAKLNEKKNQVRHESLAGINTIVAQAAAALKIALRHPDINPTAVDQSVMSMLPKMYAALLAQGEAETDPVNVFLQMEAKQLLARGDYMKFPEEDAEGCKKRVLLYEMLMRFDQMNEDPNVPREKVEEFKESIDALARGLKGVRYSIDRKRLGI